MPRSTWIILVRHAHRSLEDRTLDNGLSEKGWRQAETLRDLARREWLPELGWKSTEANFLEEDVALWSSPKRRCLETLQPLSIAWDLPIHSEGLLQEQESHESFRAVVERIEKLLEQIRAFQGRLLILCSHGDVLSNLCSKLIGMEASFEKGASLVIERTQASSGGQILQLRIR